MTSFPIPEERIVVNDLMTFGMEELAEHAHGIATEIRTGRYEEAGDLSLSVALGHLMDHVVETWHLSKMSDKDYACSGQEDYGRRCLEIPEFQDGYKIVEAD